MAAVTKTWRKGLAHEGPREVTDADQYGPSTGRRADPHDELQIIKTSHAVGIAAHGFHFPRLVHRVPSRRSDSVLSPPQWKDRKFNG